MSLSQMTPRQRLLAALRGQEVDRIPWSPYLVWWWENQSQIIQSMGQPAFIRYVGADCLLRGFSTVCKSSRIWTAVHTDAIDFTLPFMDDRCEFREHEKNGEFMYQFVTPVGSLQMASRYGGKALVPIPKEYPVKTKEDYKVLSYLVENMQFAPNFEPNDRAIRMLGEDGLYVPVVTPLLKTPFQALLEHFVGVQNLAYHMADFRETVEDLLALMNARARETLLIAAESPAEVLITYESSSTRTMSPAWFALYVAPVIRDWAQILHSANKLLLHHACGHLRGLLPIMADEGADAIESVTPPSLGDVEIWNAQKALEGRVGIIGGIEAVFFERCTLEELRSYLTDTLLPRIDPRRFILANADSCPLGVTFEKFQIVTDVVRQWKVG